MDGVSKETVEKVRQNANFEVVRENVLRFAGYTKARGTTMSMSFCLMRENRHEFGEYLAFAEDLDVDVYVHTVIHPDRSSLYTLAPDELARIVDEMEGDGGERYAALRRNGKVWTSTLASLRHHAANRRVEQVGAVKSAASKMRRLEGNSPLERAAAFVDEGRFDKALAELEPLTREGVETTQRYEALVLEGRARRLTRDAGAEAALSRAIEVWDRAPNAFIERAWLYLESGREEQALADARRAAEAIGGDRAHALAPDMFDILGLCEASAGRYEQSLEALDELRELRPNAPVAHVHRAWVLEHAGRPAEAAAAARAALAVAPGDEEVKALLGRLEKHGA
jgi:tetratricopeptide (TPR) repeat protein